MKTRILTYLPTLISCLLLAACSQNVHIDRHTSCRPPISPDYTEVTLPPNMAPPCFSLPDSCHASRLRAIYRAGDEETTVTTRNGQIAISPSKWKRLVDAASTITVRLHPKRRQMGRIRPFPPLHRQREDRPLHRLPADRTGLRDLERDGHLPTLSGKL